MTPGNRALALLTSSCSFRRTNIAFLLFRLEKKRVFYYFDNRALALALALVTPPPPLPPFPLESGWGMCR